MVSHVRRASHRFVAMTHFFEGPLVGPYNVCSVLRLKRNFVAQELAAIAKSYFLLRTWRT